MPGKKAQGNGLGSNKIKTWSPNSFGPGTFKGPKQQNVESEKRKGAGAKQ